MKTHDSVPVQFRLLRAEYEKVKHLGERRSQSPGQSARELVRKALKGKKREDIEKAVHGLDAKLKLLTEKVDLLIEMVEASTQVLLTHAGKLSAPDAKEWIEKSFR